ncbi:MAG: V-type ATP synthase subunit E [Candidatus Hydrothermarchaeales archaeon]
MDERSSVERITSKILDDANKRSQEIISDAEREGQEKIEAARRKGEEIKKKLIEDAEKAAEQTHKKIVAEARIKARTTILESKEKLIREAFEKAQERLEKLPKDKTYPEVLRKLAAETCIEIGGGGLELLVRKEDEKAQAKELEKTEKEVEDATGKKTSLKISTANIGPGVIVKRGDGKVEIDSTFQNRLELLRSELRLQVAGVLF